MTAPVLSLSFAAASAEDYLLDRIGLRVKLTAVERKLLANYLHARVRTVPARRDLVPQGSEPQHMLVILNGWVCRSKTLPDGRRQIVSLLLPGDICDANLLLSDDGQYALSSLNAVTFAQIGLDRVRDALKACPRLAYALWCHTLARNAIDREWIVNVGQRSALERVAHLFCEVFVRLRVLGRTRGHHCEFPLTQSDLAEATGLNPVHVNRTLQALRGAGYITLHGRELVIRDFEALQNACLFSDGYLHLSDELGTA